MADKVKPNINIREFSSNVVEAFVKFLYTDEIPSTEAEFTKDRLIFDLFKMGDKYKVEILREKCEKSLIRETNVDMLPEVLVASFFCKSEALLDITMDRVCTNVDLCTKMPEWDEVTKHPEVMTKMFTFSVKNRKRNAI